MNRAPALDRRLRGPCAAHRPALLDLLNDPRGLRMSSPARDHLDSCSTCRDELADLVLTGVAVRRSLALGEAIEPTADAWQSLGARLARQRAARRSGRAASPLLGVALAAGVAVMMLVPLGLPAAGRTPIQEAGVDLAAITAAGNRDAQEEARMLRVAALAGKQASSDEGSVRARLQLLRYEAAPVAEWHAPAWSPLLTSAR